EWHSRGRRFDPAWLHQIKRLTSLFSTPKRKACISPVPDRTQFLQAKLMAIWWLISLLTRFSLAG
ncbi:MAG: hypothetical protein M1492_02665, partial [Gammaproteobacteria bacterium]|nr:hypothetical protein [Gammaproteobacteria bacterium]